MYYELQGQVGSNAWLSGAYRRCTIHKGFYTIASPVYRNLLEFKVRVFKIINYVRVLRSTLNYIISDLQVRQS